ncbi:protein kinase domain-containing protein [Actinophytocola glycyrrhizae]|uniref:non-specific serine/threonine protein kinase n=1 Tax=Actinophytocola glycyrrhizae TaxID=2044873 RepID=A0ABV9S8A2_9PSEU
MRSGDVIAGRYRLDDTVGAGGMGVVWRATDLELRRVVAVKRTSTGDGEQLRREARIGAGLQHPNVISVFDVVVEDGERWLIMEYLPARSLAEILRTDGPLTPAGAAHVGAQVATALAAMHAKGMVHRDVTPANVLVAEDGTAKLADLGIAMWSEVTLTGSAQTPGTPGFLAPEVARGSAATPAADLYALGVTLAAAVEGGEHGTGLHDVLSRLTDDTPSRRLSAEVAAGRLRKAAGGTAAPRRRVSRRVLLALGAAVVVTAGLIVVPKILPDAAGDKSGGATAEAPADPAPKRDVPGAGAAARLLYGLSGGANLAQASELVRDAPTRMLTTTFHQSSELATLSGWRHNVVPDAYDKGFALHLLIPSWRDDDNPEVPFRTGYGHACGRKEPFTDTFRDDMRTLARTFAGRAEGPPLYVTVFHEVSAFACGDDGYYENTPATRAYFRALKDRYLEIRDIFHAQAPNARVGLGWQGWQATLDDHPEAGGGPSMFENFADVLAASDYNAVLSWQKAGNVEQIRRAVRILGEYGPVMVAAHANDDVPPDVIDKDMRTLLTDASIAALATDGLFAWSFNEEKGIVDAGRPTVEFVKDVVRRTGREP